MAEKSSEFHMVSRGELLKIIGISPPTLFKWRGMGLPHYRTSRTIRYNVPEVLKWMKVNGRPRPNHKSRKNKDSTNPPNGNNSNPVAEGQSTVLHDREEVQTKNGTLEND